MGVHPAHQWLFLAYATKANATAVEHAIHMVGKIPHTIHMTGKAGEGYKAHGI